MRAPLILDGPGASQDAVQIVDDRIAEAITVPCSTARILTDRTRDL